MVPLEAGRWPLRCTVNVGQARCWDTAAQDLAVSGFSHSPSAQGLTARGEHQKCQGRFPREAPVWRSSAGHGHSATEVWPQERQGCLLMWD